MTDKITEPVTPSDLNPAPLGPLSGNWADDDAEVYEDDFRPADQGPEKVSGVPHAKATTKPVTRLLSRAVTVGTVNGSVAEPIMLLPADPNRQKCVLVVTAAAARTFYIGSDKTDVYNRATIGSPINGNPIDLDGHTGALWVWSEDAASVAVAVIAVTS